MIKTSVHDNRIWITLDTLYNETDISADAARDLAKRLNEAANEAANELEKESVANIIWNAVKHIHAERYGMTVREHEELDKVLKAMKGYLEYAEQKQEGE